MKEQVQKQAREAEEEKLAFATIDWHDFLVVETIEFTKVCQPVGTASVHLLAEKSIYEVSYWRY